MNGGGGLLLLNGLLLGLLLLLGRFRFFLRFRFRNPVELIPDCPDEHGKIGLFAREFFGGGFVQFFRGGQCGGETFPVTLSRLGPVLAAPPGELEPVPRALSS